MLAQGIDVSRFFPDVVKLVSLPNLDLKKVSLSPAAHHLFSVIDPLLSLSTFTLCITRRKCLNLLSFRSIRSREIWVSYRVAIFRDKVEKIQKT